MKVTIATKALLVSAIVPLASAATWWSSMSKPNGAASVEVDFGGKQAVAGANPTLDALTENKIIPEVTAEFVPSVDLTVAYGKKPVVLGAQVLPADGKAAPAVTFKGAKPDGLYTLIMTDPGVLDPESTKTNAWQWGHWVVTNIPGKGKVADGDVVLEYSGPNPPAGNHRYAVLLAEQTKGPIEIPTITERGGFSAQKLIDTYDLTPVGGFYYMSTN